MTTDRPIVYKTGWQRVDIPQVGALDIPSTLEVRGGALKQLVGDVDTKFVLQPKGNNDLSSFKENRYARVLVITRLGKAGQYPCLGSKTSYSEQELTEMTAALKSQLDEEVKTVLQSETEAIVGRVRSMPDGDFRAFLKQIKAARGEDATQVDGLSEAQLAQARKDICSKMEAEVAKRPAMAATWLPATTIAVGGIVAPCAQYRRQLGSNPPVRVMIIRFPNYDRVHEVTVSFRDSEAQLWAADLCEAVRSLRITNVRGPASCADQQLVGGLLGEAQKMTDALLRHDYDTFVNYLPADLVSQLGGRAKAVQVMKEVLSKAPITFIRLYPYVQLAQNGRTRLAIVPTTTRVGDSGLGEGFFFALSQDGGKTWSFQENTGGSTNELTRLFPDLMKQLVLPRRSMTIGEPGEKGILMRYIESNGELVVDETTYKELDSLLKKVR